MGQLGLVHHAHQPRKIPKSHPCVTCRVRANRRRWARSATMGSTAELVKALTARSRGDDGVSGTVDRSQEAPVVPLIPPEEGGGASSRRSRGWCPDGDGAPFGEGIRGRSSTRDVRPAEVFGRGEEKIKKRTGTVASGSKMEFAGRVKW